MSAYHIYSKLSGSGIDERFNRIAFNVPNDRVGLRSLLAATVGAIVYPQVADKGLPLIKRTVRGASFGYAAGLVVALILEGFFKRR